MPVMVSEVLSFLKVPDGIIVDATVGTGGHSAEILRRISQKGFLICLDVDKDSLRIAESILSAISSRFLIYHESYQNIARCVRQAGFSYVDGILFDLGLSSFQLSTSERGFSLQNPGPLDMRFDRSKGKTAIEFLRESSVAELERVLRSYGEEKFSASIARAIKNSLPLLSTTGDLASLVVKVYRRHGVRTRIHPATRTFQAIRIAVNDELANLEKGLEGALSVLAAGGKILVLSYQSLEDRIVKRKFAGWGRAGLGKILTRKPIRPTLEEISRNRRARSARLRVFQRCAS
ncbi:MAG: 16S rRNA (cytosine(1402)-N(4))-methyltransferase RsmH [bacterium JZ-2024 1]